MHGFATGKENAQKDRLPFLLSGPHHFRDSCSRDVSSLVHAQTEAWKNPDYRRNSPFVVGRQFGVSGSLADFGKAIPSLLSVSFVPMGRKSETYIVVLGASY